MLTGSVARTATLYVWQQSPSPAPPYATWATAARNIQDAVDAAQSRPLTDNQATWLETIVPGPDVVSFWWRVSSEWFYDKLTFSINGIEQTNISGEVEWSQVSFPLPAGLHTLRWEYAKDDIMSEGLDAGWVDQVSFASNCIPPSILVQPESQTVYVTATASLSVAAAGTAPLRYQWRKNGAPIGGATNATYTIACAQTSHAGAYTVVVSNACGAITSSPPATLTVLVPSLSFVPASVRCIGGQFNCLVTGPPGVCLEVQASSNLREWAPVAVLTNLTGALQWVHPATNSAQRFYRARLLP